MKNLKRITKIAAALVATTIVVQQASANLGPVTGSVNMAGSLTLNANSLGGATTISSFGATHISSGTGTYAGTAGASPVTWTTPLSLVAGVDVVPNLWSFSLNSVTYDFNLANITSWTVTANYVGLLMGTGTLDATGYTSTSGNFTLTITDSSGGTSGQATFGFGASDTTTAVVPDGGLTATLLGGGLLMLGAFRRKLGC